MRGRRIGIGIVLLGALAAWMAYAALVPEPETPQTGMVQRTRLRIGPEVTGRLARILVAPGQSVRAGEPLALLDNPELAASLDEARVAAASAAAERDRVFSGVRQEEAEIAARAIETAQANLLLAQQGHERAVALAGRGFASQQRLDEATAQLEKTQADLDSRKAQHAAAIAGPTAEERALAEAKLTAAQATVRDVEARLAKTQLLAPRNATVGTIAGEPGEILPPGRPVLTLDLEGELFFAFSIREDRLGKIGLGSRQDLIDNHGRRIPARVTEIRPLGEFATWRAARAVGDHDLNSFRVRCEPLEAVDGLAAGMTVRLTPAP
jgi:multidrug resistance efflux pump